MYSSILAIKHAMVVQYLKALHTVEELLKEVLVAKHHHILHLLLRYG